MMQGHINWELGDGSRSWIGVVNLSEVRMSQLINRIFLSLNKSPGNIPSLREDFWHMGPLGNYSQGLGDHW